MEPPNNWDLANWIADQLQARFGFDESQLQLELLDNEAVVTVWDGDEEIVDVAVTNIPRLRERRARRAWRG